MSEALTQPLGTPKAEKPTRMHIDDFLNDVYSCMGRRDLAYAHFLFSHWRKPAIEKSNHEPFMAQFKLFVDWQGKTYRVIGASRLGDIWLTSDFNRDHGYEHRIDLDLAELSNWRDKADWQLPWTDRVAVANEFYDTAIPDTAGKCNKFTSQLSRLAVPIAYLDCTVEERAFLFVRKHGEQA